MLDYRQTDTVALGGAGFVGLIEFIEDKLKLLGGNFLALVGDRYAKLFVGFINRDDKLALRDGEFDGDNWIILTNIRYFLTYWV